MKRGRRVGAGLAVGILGTGLSLARAELVQHGDLFVVFRGNIAPTALPRDVLAPIAISISGTVRTLSGQRPPALRHIRIELNRAGRLDTRGLPVCLPSQVEALSTRGARAACGSALVGSGSYVARMAFPEQPTIPTSGRILAFNSRSHGKPTILAHIYGSRPLPITRLIVFHLRHTRGAYNVVLTGGLPARINHYGYVKQIGLRLYRTFTYHGSTHSYLSAACAAPAGFSAAVFPFAHASMSFADGRTLASTLTRSCRVRR